MQFQTVSRRWVIRAGGALEVLVGDLVVPPVSVVAAHLLAVDDGLRVVVIVELSDLVVEAHEGQVVAAELEVVPGTVGVQLLDRLEVNRLLGELSFLAPGELVEVGCLACPVLEALDAGLFAPLGLELHSVQRL